MSRYAVIALVLAAATAVLSGVPNQLLFVGTFAGWVGYGAVACGALALAARYAGLRSLPFAMVAMVALLSPFALPYSYGLLLFAAAFAIASRLKTLPEGRFAGLAAAVIAGAWCVYAIGCWAVLQLVPAAEWAATTNRLAGETWVPALDFVRMTVPLGHANHTSGLGVLLLPVFAALAFASRKRARVVWALAACAAGLMIFAGGSRAALLAPGVVLVAFVLLLPARRVSPRRKAGLVAACVVATALLVAVHAPFRAWLLSPSIKSASDLTRRDYAEGCLAMLRAKPLTGFGAGSLPTAFPAYAPDNMEQFSCYHAHSTPFQWGAEFGIPGIALFLLVAGLSGFALWRVSRSEGTVFSPGTGLATASAAYALFCLFDYQANIPALGVVCGGVLGSALPVSRSDPHDAGAIRRAGIFTARGFFAAAAVAAAWTTVSGSYFRGEIRAAARASSSDEALDHFLHAADAAPENAGVHGLAAAALEEKATRTGDARFVALADREWAGAQRLAPGIPHFAMRRGLLALTRDPVAAKGFFKEALATDPKLRQAWTGLAAAYWKSGDVASAEETLALELFSHPEERYSPFWSRLSGVSATSVVRRFESLRARYAVAHPGDTFALRELGRCSALFARRAAAGEDLAAYVRPLAGNSEWRKKLFPAMERGDEAALRALIAATYATQSVVISPDRAAPLLRAYRGEAGASGYAGVRTVAVPEDTLWYGAYLGVADMPWHSPFLRQEDLLASLFVTDDLPAEIRASREFLREGFARLP